jgi:hypothetical protein
MINDLSNFVIWLRNKNYRIEILSDIRIKELAVEFWDYEHGED